MADQGKWAKVWCTSPDDPDTGILPNQLYACWVKLQCYTKVHGTEGVLILVPPSDGIHHPLEHWFQVSSFSDVISVIHKLPNCIVSSVTNTSVSFKIEFRNWLKYQGDYSTERVHKFREKNDKVKRSKKRGEEKRGEETRREEEHTQKEIGTEAKTDLASGPASLGLPEWFTTCLETSKNFNCLLLPKHSAFWKSMSTAYDPYEWLKWDEQIHKADAWIEANPQRRPRQQTRFLKNWFERAVEHGRIQHAKEARAGRASEGPAWKPL